MQKLRLIDVKNDLTSDLTGLCSSDSRLVALINEATRRLLKRGKWVGSTQRFRINATSGFITWPRQIETIEAFAICKTPGMIRNDWYEFVPTGIGLVDSDDNWHGNLFDRETASTFDDITVGVANRKVRAYCDLSTDTDVVVTVQGYDENGNWIRTLVDGEYIDGEQISPAVAGTLSTNKFSSITGVFKDVSDGAIRLYEYNTTTTANVKSLAYYEPDETNPIYRRSIIPGIMNMDACSDQCGTCRFVTVKAKLRFIPVVNDNDWVMLGDVDAIKLAVQAILKERKDLSNDAGTYWMQAISELEWSLRSYYGAGAVPVPRFQNPTEWGGGGIQTLN